VPAKGSTAVPGWNNPPDWGGVSEQKQYASVPGREYNVLIQGTGKEWARVPQRAAHPLRRLFLRAGSCRAHRVLPRRRPLEGARPADGRLIERFNAVERASHWLMAFCFIALALTGVVILWGKHIILPWLGYSGFSWLTIVSKNVHNFVGPLFIFSLVVMFLLYVKDNLPAAHDVELDQAAGGMFGGPHVPSGKFNAGEKMWFWLGIVILGIAVSVTGVILDFPNWNQTREIMQQANVVHGVGRGLLRGRFLRPHVPRHARRAGRVWRDARRLRRRVLGEGAHEIWYHDVKANKRPEKFDRPPGTPGATTRSRETTDGTQAHSTSPRSRRSSRSPALRGRKLRPPPPLDEKGKAPPREEGEGRRRRREGEGDQAPRKTTAVKNYQGNMKKAGKPIPKPTRSSAAAPPRRARRRLHRQQHRRPAPAAAASQARGEGSRESAAQGRRRRKS
jgi:formate dehydrogenase subunit gamma